MTAGIDGCYFFQLQITNKYKPNMALEFDPQSEYLKVKLATPPFPLKDGLVWLAGLEVKLAKVPQISDPLRTTIITWSSN